MFKRLWHDFVVNRYKMAGLHYGLVLSYVPIAGECIGFDKIKNRFLYWEQKYKKLGYKKVRLNDFIDAGGYIGEIHLFDKLKVKEEVSEEINGSIAERS